MPVDLVELVGPLERAVNPPGVDFYPGTHISEWRDRLADAFWVGRLAGFFSGFTCVDGVVSPTTGDEDLERMLQQIIVQYAAVTALKNRITQMTTSTSYQAGPVKAETQRSAQVLLELLRQARDELQTLRDDLSTRARYGTTAFIDTAVVSTNRFLDAAAETWGWAN